MVKKILDPHCLCCQETFLTYFSILSPVDLQSVQNMKVVELYKKGALIFQEGTKPNGIYCINSGNIKIYKHGSDGREHITRLAFSGEFVGLKALLTGNLYSVSAQALEDSVICFISKNDFFELTIRYTEFTKAIVSVLSKQLVDAEEKMVSLAQKPVKERLADSLLFLYQQFSSHQKDRISAYLNLTRQDLANIVGTSPETVIRLLTDWKESNIIAIKGRKIFILDELKLRKIACHLS